MDLKSKTNEELRQLLIENNSNANRTNIESVEKAVKIARAIRREIEARLARKFR